MSEPTCGERYRQLAETLFPSGEFTERSHDLFSVRPEDSLYAACSLGFMWGQAEKVASGACGAFMIRPSVDWWRWSAKAMRLICAHYGLHVVEDDLQWELWGCATLKLQQHIPSLSHRFAINSPEWHRTRAWLCGIRDVDDHYHERAGYGTRGEPDAVMKGEHP